MQKSKNLRTQIYYKGSLPFSGQAQVDAAAKVEDDGKRCGGGGAWATEGLWENEEEEWGGPGVPIYKEIGEQAGAKNKEGKWKLSS